MKIPASLAMGVILLALFGLAIAADSPASAISQPTAASAVSCDYASYGDKQCDTAIGYRCMLGRCTLEKATQTEVTAKPTSTEITTTPPSTEITARPTRAAVEKNPGLSTATQPAKTAQKPVCKTYVDSQKCTITKCSDGKFAKSCPAQAPSCRSYADSIGCTVTECSDGKKKVSCTAECKKYFD